METSCFEWFFRNVRQVWKLPFLDLFHQLNTADRNCRHVESFESEHRSNPLLHAAMILLHHVVQVFTAPNPHAPAHTPGRFQFPNRPMSSRIPVESDHPWCAIVLDCPAEEPFGGTHIPPFTQEEIH